ncbi:MAG: carotenoid biosynthesis protein [Candidatus Helarchaeota archaeon]|nr:carotenoid biosynthesis protein [Candidatus Helarchaeota archaeon]
MDKFTRNFSIVILTILGICIAVSTIIHHLFPWIFQVPAVNPAYLSTSPTIELIVMDIGSVIVALIVFNHSYHKYGLWRSLLFFSGSFIFTGLEEAMWILSGRFGLVFPSYFFTRGGLWFFEVPFYTCIGWFVVAYSCVFLAEKILPNRSIWLHAALGAFLAMDLDLWTDPVMVNLNLASAIPADSGMWVWSMTNTLTIFGIPLMNFLGWFLVIFLFAILWKIVPKQQERWGYRKTTLVFYGCVPILLAICLVVLSGIEILLVRNFFPNVEILPIIT